VASANLPLIELPPEVARKITKHSLVPAALIARLARDLSCRGKGIGEVLLLHALDLILRSSAEIGLALVLVDAKDESAETFYRRYGFQSLNIPPHRSIFSRLKGLFGKQQTLIKSHPVRLFLKVDVLRKIPELHYP